MFLFLCVQQWTWHKKLPLAIPDGRPPSFETSVVGPMTSFGAKGGRMLRPSWHVEPWEVDFDRRDRAGRGGFGEVFVGHWAGQQAAVKEADKMPGKPLGRVEGGGWNKLIFKRKWGCFSSFTWNYWWFRLGYCFFWLANCHLGIGWRGKYHLWKLGCWKMIFLFRRLPGRYRCGAFGLFQVLRNFIQHELLMGWWLHHVEWNHTQICLPKYRLQWYSRLVIRGFKRGN